MTSWQVVIADRGWVYVGRVTREGDQVVIGDCQNVRRWGTSGGLGELALKGPRSETTLDFYGTVRIHVLAVLGAIECDDSVWNAWAEKNRAGEPKPKAKR